MAAHCHVALLVLGMGGGAEWWQKWLSNRVWGLVFAQRSGCHNLSLHNLSARIFSANTEGLWSHPAAPARRQSSDRTGQIADDVVSSHGCERCGSSSARDPTYISPHACKKKTTALCFYHCRSTLTMWEATLQTGKSNLAKAPPLGHLKCFSPFSYYF